MRIATITNWAYGVTVCLTIASGIVMLMASHADNVERQAVKQRQIFDQLTEEIEAETWMRSDLARLYAIKKEPDVLKAYQAKEGELKNIEHKVGQLKDTGATGEELALLYEGLKIVDGLQDEQQAAIASVARGEEQQAKSTNLKRNAPRARLTIFVCCWISALLPMSRRRPTRRKRCVPLQR